MRLRGVISDFGGVLTSPLVESFMAFQNETGISPAALGRAMGRSAERHGTMPLFELEKGRMSEAHFLGLIADELEAELGHRPELHRFSEVYFRALRPNQTMIELMCELRKEGYRMALLTNNVREWEPLWRPMLPVDEIFEVVVDSAFVGTRKPEPEIYKTTLERLGLGGEECLFIDDVEENCRAARDAGMVAIHFKGNDQAVSDVRGALRG